MQVNHCIELCVTPLLEAGVTAGSAQAAEWQVREISVAATGSLLEVCSASLEASADALACTYVYRT